jgi:hypothetical protein
VLLLIGYTTRPPPELISRVTYAGSSQDSAVRTDPKENRPGRGSRHVARTCRFLCLLIGTAAITGWGFVLLGVS